MNRNPWVSTLVLFLNLSLYISDVIMKPNITNLQIWEGNVTVTWDPPQENPVGCLYIVQLKDYSSTSEVWETVPKCNLLNDTVCNIGLLPSDLNFHVRVGALEPKGNFSWSSRKSINVKRSQLFPPSFSMLSTPFSVQVKVHRKDLKDIFPYGLEYTAYLWPDGQENQTQSMSIDDDGNIKFNLLQALQVYCVRVQVKSTSGASSISTEQCIQLPLEIVQIICFILIGLLGFVAVSWLFVCCFLRRPTKTPFALKPFVNSWEPMTVGSVQVEIVTDKGWLLIPKKKEENKHIEKKFAEEEKDRRESLDSGVSMEQLYSSGSNTKADGQTGDIHEDSGCESLKGNESIGSVCKETELFSLDESHDGVNEQREDSGLGLSHQEMFTFLEGGDSELLSEVVVGNGYRSQSPSNMFMKNKTPQPCNMDTNMTAPSSGYRSGQVTCMCSDHEYCLWCKPKKLLNEGCQSVTALTTNFSHTVGDSDDDNSASSNDQKNNLFQKVNLLSMDTTQSVSSDMDTDTSPFLISCPLLLQSGDNQACTIDRKSFRLDDVKLDFS